jgi:hypothetical protein
MSVTAIILSLMVLHFIADFMCQNQWMATNKSKRLGPLWAHVGVYTGVMWFLGMLYWPILKPNLTLGNWTMFCLVTGLIHCFVDFNTSRMNSWMWNKVETYKKQGWNGGVDRWVHWFFVGIGFDQLIHTFCLVYAAKHYFNF